MPVSAGIRNGFHEKPYVMYSDKNHRLSDTAVFSTIAHPRRILASGWGQIMSVDGKKTSCWDATTRQYLLLRKRSLQTQRHLRPNSIFRAFALLSPSSNGKGFRNSNIPKSF